jgi:hypothetical protein
MFVNGADFFVFKPGIVLLVLGMLVTLPLSFGPRSVGRITFSLYTELFGVALSLLGLQSFFMGCLAQILYDRSGAAAARWTSIFRYTRTVVTSAIAFAAGLGLTGFLVAEFFRTGLELPPVGVAHHVAVVGLLLMVSGFMTFTFTLLLHAAALQRRQPSGSRSERR